MKKSYLICATLVVLAVFTLVEAKKTKWHQLNGYTFDKYVMEFGKSYAPEEYAARKKIFEEKLEKIRAHNNDPTKTWKSGVNHLTDLSENEFTNMLGYEKVNVEKRHKTSLVQQHKFSGDVSALPTSIDWREKGVVTSVKDQGQCGSCWSFGTAEVVESHYAIATGHLAVLSEQQILDCTANPQQCGGTGGCQGGTAELAYNQIVQQGGLSSEWTYPYVSWFGSNFQCNSTRVTPVAKLAGYVALGANQYAPLMDAIANAGPVALAVDASAWSVYESGVFDGCNQTNPDIDHAVVLVGYGTDDKLGDYWLIRNSWTPLWGENGYIRIKRESTVRCGTDITPLDGTGCAGGPSEVTVCGTCGILFDPTYPLILTQ